MLQNLLLKIAHEYIVGMSYKQGDKVEMALCTDGSLQTTMPTGNTSPILPPSSSIIVVWLCGKINMYYSLFCVCAVLAIVELVNIFVAMATVVLGDMCVQSITAIRTSISNL